MDKKKLTIEYLQKHSSFVQEICEPLFENFKIRSFHTQRINEDGTYCLMGNHTKYLSNYVKNIREPSHVLTDHAKNTPLSRKAHIIWPKQSDDLVMQSLYRFNVSHGFTIYKKHETFIELWSFGTSHEDKGIIDFYIRNIDIIEKFMLFFDVKTKDIRGELRAKDFPMFAKQPDLGIPNSPISDSAIKRFLEEVEINQIQFHFGRHNFTLTRRQTETLYLMSIGKTMKEIASSLGISARTVETYINQIKSKSGLNYRSQLVQMALENFSKHHLLKRPS